MDGGDGGVHRHRSLPHYTVIVSKHETEEKSGGTTQASEAKEANQGPPPETDGEGGQGNDDAPPESNTGKASGAPKDGG